MQSIRRTKSTKITNHIVDRTIPPVSVIFCPIQNLPSLLPGKTPQAHIRQTDLTDDSASSACGGRRCPDDTKTTKGRPSPSDCRRPRTLPGVFFSSDDEERGRSSVCLSVHRCCCSVLTIITRVMIIRILLVNQPSSSSSSSTLTLLLWTTLARQVDQRKNMIIYHSSPFCSFRFLPLLPSSVS